MVHYLSPGWTVLCYLLAFVFFVLATVIAWTGREFRTRPLWPVLLTGGLAAWIFPLLYNTWQVWQH